MYTVYKCVFTSDVFADINLFKHNAGLFYDFCNVLQVENNCNSVLGGFLWRGCTHHVGIDFKHHPILDIKKKKM